LRTAIRVLTVLCFLLVCPVQAADSLGLAGQWDGGTGDWGEVVVGKDGTATYTSTYDGKLGLITFSDGCSGEWRESSAVEGHPLRRGVFTWELSKDGARAAVRWEATDEDEGRPRQGKSVWRRL
jgi:hypothetical protein